MKKGISIAIIAITFVWIGLVTGLSFIEAPLKFQAPGITLELGLGIGKLVFGVLTKIELAFMLLLIAFLLLSRASKRTWFLFVVPFLIVIVDNAFLMPILDDRIKLILSGKTPPPSSAHVWYIALEVIKLISLFVAGILYTKERLR